MYPMDRSMPDGIVRRFDRPHASNLCGKSFSTLGSPPLDDVSARLGGHALQKAMGSRTFDFAGLIRPFHSRILLIVECICFKSTIPG